MQPETVHRAGSLETIRLAAAALTPGALAGVTPAVAVARASGWAKAVSAGRGQPLEALGEILPSTQWFQARLVTKRDESDLAEDAKADGVYGQAYSALQDALATTKASAVAVEAMIDEVWRMSGAADGLEKGPLPVLKPSERWIPGKSGLAASHQYALDVFFTSVRRHGAEEKGPVIRSMSSGVVVSAAGDWSGGDKPSLYRGGGLSPKAGNGVVVYDPDARRYYAYFHLSDVSVRVGQVVEAGKQLGRGGNTGVNARKKGHGGHVHVEIHDIGAGAWTSYRIRDFIVSLH